MDVQETTLRFRGPYALVGDQAPPLWAETISKESGIYVWGVPYVGGGLIVTYVGETQTSFGQRVKEHAIQTLGGNYRVSDPDLLCQGIDRVLWNGLWRNGTRSKLPEFLDRFIELAPVITKMLRTLRILAAPFRSDTRVRRRVEAALATHIWRQPPPASALLPRDIRYYGRRSGEETMTVHVSSEVDVLGFPTTIEA